MTRIFRWLVVFCCSDPSVVYLLVFKSFCLRVFFFSIRSASRHILSLFSELSRLSRRPLRVLSNQYMPASAPATPAASKPAKVSAKPNKDTPTHTKKHNQDANNPSTSSANSSKPTVHRQKAASLRIAQALAMFDSFDRKLVMSILRLAFSFPSDLFWSLQVFSICRGLLMSYNIHSCRFLNMLNEIPLDI